MFRVEQKKVVDKNLPLPQSTFLNDTKIHFKAPSRTSYSLIQSDIHVFFSSVQKWRSKRAVVDPWQLSKHRAWFHCTVRCTKWAKIRLHLLASWLAFLICIKWLEIRALGPIGALGRLVGQFPQLNEVNLSVGRPSFLLFIKLAAFHLTDKTVNEFQFFEVVQLFRAFW